MKKETGWQEIFDAITDLIFVQDRDSVIIKANKAFARAMKFKIEDIIGRKCYELLHKSDKPWPNCPFQKTLKDKTAHSEEVDDPNIGIPLLVTTSPLFDNSGNVAGSVHIAKDITEMKKTENELKEKIHELARFRNVAVGRELKMIELKEEIKKLKKQ